MITTRDIARAAGVSHPTVSSVLNNRWAERRISADTRDRVLATARRLRYRPNRLARGLKSRKTNTIGLVMRTMEHPHQAYMNERIVLLLEAHKYEVLATFVPEFTEVAEIEELHDSHLPEAMIIGPLYAQSAHPYFTKLVQAGFPLVGYHGGASFPGDQVTHDVGQILPVAVAHLRELGHARIDRVTSRAHYDELFAALTDGGVTHHHYGTLENGFAFGRQVPVGAGHPTAYVLEDPLLAIGFLRALSQRGIRVPDQIAFTTSSLGKIGNYLPISLTTVYPDLDEIATKVVDLTIKRLRGELPAERQLIQLAPQLTVGETTVKAINH